MPLDSASSTLLSYFLPSGHDAVKAKPALHTDVTKASHSLIVERSFTPGKSVKDLLVQRLISEKKKDDAKKKDDLNEIA